MKQSTKALNTKARPTPTGTHNSQGKPSVGQERPKSACVYNRFGGHVECYIVENGRRYSPQEWERRRQR